MTPPDRDALRKLCEAARLEPVPPQCTCTDAYGPTSPYCKPHREHFAALDAVNKCIWTAIPALLDELERVEKERDAADGLEVEEWRAALARATKAESDLAAVHSIAKMQVDAMREENEQLRADLAAARQHNADVLAACEHETTQAIAAYIRDDADAMDYAATQAPTDREAAACRADAAAQRELADEIERGSWKDGKS